MVAGSGDATAMIGGTPDGGQQGRGDGGAALAEHAAEEPDRGADAARSRATCTTPVNDRSTPKE